MLFSNYRHRIILRWLAIPPIATLAAFIAFNLVAPFRLMQGGLWPADGGPAAAFGFVVVDALLLLAPLTVVIVFAAWLTAPAAKVLAVRLTAGLLAGVCAAFTATLLAAQHWHGAMVLIFGALAAIVTAGFIVRYERRQAMVAAAEGAGTDEAKTSVADSGGVSPDRPPVDGGGY